MRYAAQKPFRAEGDIGAAITVASMIVERWYMDSKAANPHPGHRDHLLRRLAHLQRSRRRDGLELLYIPLALQGPPRAPGRHRRRAQKSHEIQ